MKERTYVCMYGRSDGSEVITKPKFLVLMGYQNLLAMGLRTRAPSAPAELRYEVYWSASFRKCSSIKSVKTCSKSYYIVLTSNRKKFLHADAFRYKQSSAGAFFLCFFDVLSSLSHSSMASSSTDLASFFDLFIGLEDAILFPSQLFEKAKHHGKVPCWINDFSEFNRFWQFMIWVNSWGRMCCNT